MDNERSVLPIPTHAWAWRSGSNKRKVKKRNTKPNFQRVLGSLTSTVVDVGAQSAIYVIPPESSIEITVARIVR